MKTIVEEEGMMKYINLGTQVNKAVWDDDKSRWVLSLAKSSESEGMSEWDEECDVFLNGTGFLKSVKHDPV